jgi:hypothetical protein
MNGVDDFVRWKRERIGTERRDLKAAVFDAFVDERASGRCYHVRSRFSGATN